jgi:hypothetical protein
VVGLATLVDLPSELICAIAKYLDLADLSRCVHVSKAWEATWKQADIVPDLCNHFFPGLLQTIQAQGKPAHYTVFGEQSRQYLVKSLLKYTTRSVRWYHYPEDSFFTVDRDIHLDGTLPSIDHRAARYEGPDGGRRWLSQMTRYKSGRIAWQPDNFLVVIDDLYSRKRRVISPPGAVQSALSVALCDLSQDIVVLDSNDRALQVAISPHSISMH